MILVLAGAGAGCAPGTPAERIRLQAAEAGLQPVRLQAGGLILAGWLRGRAPVLSVYLEGDGQAWVRRTQPARDPTPTEPVGLRLAALDGTAAAAYLARPCQAVTGADRAGCRPWLWTHGRFGPEVLESTSAALGALKRRAGATRLRLVGWSGGGTLAVLLAARRDDVCRVVTLAAPLDLAAWAAHHRVSPLVGSIDPAAEPSATFMTPQIHLMGAADSVVPPAVNRMHLAQAPPGAPVRHTVLAGVGHRDGWPAAWPTWDQRARCAD